MATIGLDSLYYAPITMNNGAEEFGETVQYKGAIKLSIDVESAQADLDADDSVFESVEEFTKGTISLEMADLPAVHEQGLCGATVPKTNTTISSAEDVGPYVAVGFRARKANGKYRYYWIYKVKFGQPKVEANTKGTNITYTTTTLTGTVYALAKEGYDGKHHWRTRFDETGAAGNAAADWFSEVQEPTPMIDLIVSSAAGTSSGKTKITVTGYSNTGSDQAKYKTGTTATTVNYNDVLTTGWTNWNGSDEITATNGQKITVAYVESATNKARAAGSATIVSAT